MLSAKTWGFVELVANLTSVCAISVIRQAILYKNNASGVKEADATWTEIPNYVWL